MYTPPALPRVAQVGWNKMKPEKRISWNDKKTLLAKARALGIQCSAAWSPERLREAIRAELNLETGDREAEEAYREHTQPYR